MKTNVLKNLTKFTGKHLCQSLFFKKETLAQVFPCEFCEIFKNTFSTEYLQTTTSVSLRNQNSLKNITKIHLTNTPDSGL